MSHIIINDIREMEDVCDDAIRKQKRYHWEGKRREEKHHIEQCNLIGAKENAKTFLDRRTEGGANISDELYKTLLRQIDECYEQFSEELLLGYSV